MIHESKGIYTVEDFNEYGSGMFEEFLESFTLENKLIREVNEDDVVNVVLPVQYK